MLSAELKKDVAVGAFDQQNQEQEGGDSVKGSGRPKVGGRLGYPGARNFKINFLSPVPNPPSWAPRKKVCVSHIQAKKKRDPHEFFSGIWGLIGLETEELLESRLPGKGGDHSIVLWSLCPVIFGIDFSPIRLRK